MKLKNETWRIFRQALQKHFLTHIGGGLSSGSKDENRNFPGPEKQSVLAAFEGIREIHTKSLTSFMEQLKLPDEVMKS